MKPHLLMLLLMALPPLISNILACENAEKTDPTPATATEKVCVAPLKENATAPVTSAAPNPAQAKPKPARGTGTSTGIKAWTIM